MHKTEMKVTSVFLTLNNNLMNNNKFRFDFFSVCLQTTFVHEINETEMEWCLSDWTHDDYSDVPNIK